MRKKFIPLTKNVLEFKATFSAEIGFIPSLLIRTKNKMVMVLTLLFNLFSLGKIEDKIIKIIIIPPINSIRRIMENHTIPASIPIIRNIMVLTIKTLKLTLIGLKVWTANSTVTPIVAVRVVVIIFLSLKKNFSFGY
jgi:tetrahydromethanopterin S-methyltransferase subunit C